MKFSKNELSKNDYLRYSRHLTLPGFGIKAQQKLINSSVLVVGAGGLGSPIIMYLAAAGIGKIGIVDFDVVDAMIHAEREDATRSVNVVTFFHLDVRQIQHFFAVKSLCCFC